MSEYTITNTDCLEFMRSMPDESIDSVIADPPYGTTACRWDSIIPLEAMWGELWRITKPSAAVVLFASQPFTSALITSCIDRFKHELIWRKERTGAPGVAKFRPLPVHESVIVFGRRRITYNPVMAKGEPYIRSGARSVAGGKEHRFGFAGKQNTRINSGTRFPTSVMDFKTQRGNIHPSQKPLGLLEYLVRMYTDDGDTVLDFAMGSGTTGVACMLAGRNFVGCDTDGEYCRIAQGRIESARTEWA